VTEITQKGLDECRALTYSCCVERRHTQGAKMNTTVEPTNLFGIDTPLTTAQIMDRFCDIAMLRQGKVWDPQARKYLPLQGRS